jgi:acetyl-CoA acetyltransferase
MRHVSRTRASVRAIERAEINKACAAITIVAARELGTPQDNVEGGAMAHGRPISAGERCVETSKVKRRAAQRANAVAPTERHHSIVQWSVVMSAGD